MPNYSKECQPIATKIAGLKTGQQALQQELQHAAPGEKAALVAQIKEIGAEITKQQKALADCVKLHPYVPPQPPPPNPCLSLLKELNQLKKKLADDIRKAIAPLQEELQHAAGSEKAAIVAQIKAARAEILKNSPLPKQIAAKQKQYDDCLIAHGGVLALDATFKGTATMQTTNDNAPGPFKQNVNIGIHFGEWDHGVFDVRSFPPISVTYDTPIGSVTTTVSLKSGSGTFDSKAKTVALNLSLFFHHSTSLAGDSSLDIQLGTTKLLDAAGNITVSGSAPFQGGYLDDDICSLTVDGKITPHP
jgi:hypothetical protein